MIDLAKAHRWRLILDVGEVIDTRDIDSTTTTSPEAGVWREGRVVEARSTVVVVGTVYVSLVQQTTE